MLSDPDEDVRSVLIEEDRARNVALLERSVKLLGLAKDLSAARNELYKETKATLVEVRDTPAFRLRVLDLFDEHARTILELVRDTQTRDAYVEVLTHLHYAQAHEGLVGGLPKSYARRFGGWFVRGLSSDSEALVQELNTRYRFWVNEAFKRGGDAVDCETLQDIPRGFIPVTRLKPETATTTNLNDLSEDGLDLTSEGGRNSAVASYILYWTCSEAALARSARVDPADLSKWKKGSLRATFSDKKRRIEAVLRNNEPPTPSVRQKSDD